MLLPHYSHIILLIIITFAFIHIGIQYTRFPEIPQRRNIIISFRGGKSSRLGRIGRNGTATGYNMYIFIYT